MKIRSIEALEILDSRGNPTLETTVNLEDGSFGSALVPAGASTGSHEAKELRDADPKRYFGLGLQKAIASIETIAAKLVGQDAEDQKSIDRLMIKLDRSVDKAKLGANAILSVSLATACAQAKHEKKHLFSYLAKFNPGHAGKYTMPLPLLNVINGGQHADWATDFQEYLLIPIGAPNFTEGLRWSAEVYHQLKKVLQNKKLSILVGDEGGFAPQVKNNSEPLELMSQAVEQAGYVLGQDFVFGLDVAASAFAEASADKQNSKYKLTKEGKTYEADELADYYLQLMSKYPVKSLEDPFAEDDWQAFADFSAKAPADAQIIGDDLYVTQIERLRTGLEQKATNAILIKPNQVGTLTETIEVINQAAAAGLNCVVSHRSGETTDTFIADLCVAMACGQIKAGAPARGERVAKYNRLLKIESILGQSNYAGWPRK